MSPSIDRLAYTLAERSQMADMVEMIMGHKNRREGIYVQTVLLKGFLETTQTYTGIDKNAFVISSKIITVSTTTAGKTHEPNCTHVLPF
jgi:hypothetical protein